MTEITQRLTTALADRYRIERHIGDGGMAIVFQAHDAKHDRKVALKVLRPELAAVIGAERFLNEIKVTANLQHPHILPLHDSGEADSFLYYVMPFIDGDTLREKLDREKQLDIDEAVEITRTVCAALDYAHRQGVIHRDIKPENILIHDEQALVADFGIALAVSQASGQRLTETGLSIGTPHYMSPEQAMGDRELDARSDVYSVGAMLYEMLAGDPPYTGTSAQAIVAKVITEKAPPVTTARDTVPGHVAAAIAKALNKMPADRFKSAADFAAALTNPQFTSAPVAESAEPTTVAPARDLKTMAGWAAAMVLAITLGFVMLRGSGDPQGSGTMQLTLDPGVDRLHGLARIAISRDGGTFAMTRRDGNDSPMYVRGPNEPDFRSLPGTESAWWATFSPDGLWIAYADRNTDKLMKVAVSGGRPISLYTDPDLLAEEVHWGDDDTIVFASPSGVHRVPANGGVPERLRDNVFAPHILPDGSGVLSGTFRSATRSIELFEPGQDSARVIIVEGTMPNYLESGHILFAHPGGGLFVVPFDLRTRQVTGERTPVMDGVMPTYYNISANGTLVFRPGVGTGIINPNVDPTGGSRREVRLVVIGIDQTIDTLRLAPRPLAGTRISPDGRRLIYGDPPFGEVAHLYMYDFELGGPTQVTFEGINEGPVWSPDGTRIAFASRRDGSDRRDIYIKPVDENGAAENLLNRPRHQFPSDWTPDGILTFTERGGGISNLWRIDEEGDDEPEPFLVTEWTEAALSVSPDGRWAVYQSDETQSQEVYVRAFPSGEGQRRVSTGGGGMPRGSPDGETIYFARRGESADTLFAARVQLTPSFLVRSTDVVHTAEIINGFDVHPDSTRLVVEVAQRQGETGEAVSARGQVVVVLNWFEELQRRLGNN